MYACSFVDGVQIRGGPPVLRPAFAVSKHARLPPTGYWAHLTFYNDVFMDRGREMQVCVVDRGLMIRWVARCYLPRWCPVRG